LSVAAQIAVEKTTLQFDKPFSYIVPDELAEKVKCGCRVMVPFGGGNRTRQGIVLKLANEEADQKLKKILSLTDEKPILNKEMLMLLSYLKKYTFCTYFDALRVLIPSGISMNINTAYRLCAGAEYDRCDLTASQQAIVDYLYGRRGAVDEQKLFGVLGINKENADIKKLCELGIIEKNELVKRKVLDEKITMVRLCGEFDENAVKLTAKQKKAAALLQEHGSMSLKELCYFTPATKAVADRLKAAGIVEYYEREVYRNPYSGKAAKSNEPETVLNDEQTEAYNALKSICGTNKAETALLYGVTGSGKTQVFLKLVDYVVSQGKSVIVMVPEISLTPQTIDSFHRRFGSGVAVLHSGLSMSERLDEWKRIRNGEANIVVGTRSAVFAPLENIGLIVIDEEQEHTYKSENAPRFHARDVAKIRCMRHNCLLLLASATPSIESYYAAKSGKIRLVTLKSRYTQSKLPDVYLVDMKNQTGAISQTLIDELYLNLQKGEQSILLLNRRGYHTIVKCSSCGEVATCPNCSVALTYHSANSQLMCHQCGYSQDIIKACAKCGSELVRYSGAGTQKIEEELNTIFPDARVLRMDMDTTMSRFSHEKHFGDFAAGKYDIMIGTQMIAKGLNFPKVTLVGVLSADQSLYADDFRSFEKSFSLLTQVVGRCGRGELAGRAYIQTFSPENQIIELAASQRYDDYFKEEISFRRLNTYPPFCDIVGVGFSGINPQNVKKASQRFSKILIDIAKSEYADIPLRLLGPSEGAVFKAAGKYRYKLIIKCKKNEKLCSLLWQCLYNFYGDKQNNGITAYVDINYDGSL